MKSSILQAFLAVASVSGVCARGADPHPVENVIELLKGLKTQVKEGGQAEEVTYSKFAKWCADSEKTLSKAIKTSEDTIEQLEDTIEADEELNITLLREISTLADEIDKHTQDNTDAEGNRTAANGLYQTADGDYATTIAAFKEVLTALEGAKTQADAASLVQGLASRFPAVAASMLVAGQTDLLANDTNGTDRPDLLAQGDYANAEKKYTFKSDNIIELVKELKAAFQNDRVEATKAETNAANAYNLAKDARTNAINAATATKTAKETAQGDCAGRLTTDKASLGDAQGDLTADKATLASTSKQCDMKQTEWEERSAVRANEQEAITQAIKILGKATGVRTEKPSNPLPPVVPTQAPDFLQVAQTGPQSRALNLLKTQAKHLHSKSFMRFAEELEGKLAGPFDQVNNMIQKMIFRLMAEQKDEDDHKNWCDLELNKTEASKQNKEDFLTAVGLKLTAANADVDDLAQKVSDGHAAIATIDTFIEEATEIRKEGKAENKAAIKDAKAAGAALARAISILEDFYKKSGKLSKEAWEFTQKGAGPVTLPSKPANWDAPYTGVTDPKSQPDGIISVLELVASDFATMEADTRAQESTDEKNYQEELKTQQIEKARLTKEVEMRTQEKQRLADKIIAMEKSEKRAKDEKAAVEQYLKDLEPACVDGDSSYDERKTARTTEIDALKEAQVILADADKPDPADADKPDPATSFLQARRQRHS